ERERRRERKTECLCVCVCVCVCVCLCVCVCVCVNHHCEPKLIYRHLPSPDKQLYPTPPDHLSASSFLLLFSFSSPPFSLLPPLPLPPLPPPYIIFSVLLLIIAQTCRKDLTHGTDNSTNYKVCIQFGREREKDNYVYCRCLLPFWTLLSFLVLVPIIYAIVIELDVLIRT